MNNGTQKLKFGEKLAYGMGDCGANVYVALAGSFLTAYYTDTVGIAVAAVGTMMLLSRILDGVTDLIMGALVDKTRSKYGKARPWVLWTAPFMAGGLIAAFAVPKSMYGSNAALVYAYITYIFLNCLVYTANNLPYNALLSRMTLDVQDRAGTASMRFIMTQVTSLIVNAVVAPLIASVGWVGTATILGAVQFIMLVWCFLGCKEYVADVKGSESGEGKPAGVPLNVALPALLKNQYFYLQAMLFLILYVGVVAAGTSTVYYANIVLGSMAYIGALSAANTIPAIISNFLNPAMVGKFGKRKVMIGGTILMIVGGVVIGLAGANVNLALVGIAIKGFGMGPIMSGIFALTADVVDYGEWKTGVRSEGLVNSCTSFGMKVGIGLGSAAFSMILASGGYDGMAAQQTEAAVNSIKFAFGYFNSVMGVVCLVLILLMNIDKNIKQIQKDLEAKRA